MPQDLPPSTWSGTLIFHALTGTLYPRPHPMPTLWTFVLCLMITFWCKNLEWSSNVLDLILTRTPEFISNVEVLPDHFDSGHLLVSFDIKMHSGLPNQSTPRQVYNFKKPNFSELNELLSYVPWCGASLEDDMDIGADKVRDLQLAAADMCIPQFTVKRRTNPHGSIRKFCV